MRSILPLVIVLTGLVAAYFPPEPEGITILKSKFHENFTISYKEVSHVLHSFRRYDTHKFRSLEYVRLHLV